MKKLLIMLLIGCFTAATPTANLVKDATYKGDIPESCTYDTSSQCDTECETNDSSQCDTDCEANASSQCDTACEKNDSSNCDAEEPCEKPQCKRNIKPDKTTDKAPQCNNEAKSDTDCENTDCEASKPSQTKPVQKQESSPDSNTENSASKPVSVPETKSQNNCPKETECQDDKCDNKTSDSKNTLWSIINELISNRESCNQKVIIGGKTSENTVSRETASQNVTSREDTAITLSSEAYKVYELVNSERAKQGLPALTYRSDLQSAADVRAKEIVELFSHTRPNGKSCFTAITESGVSYTAAGENIAYGQRSAEEVMTGWMNSSGHRANILSNKFTGIAVGLYEKNGVKYWVQTFIR